MSPNAGKAWLAEVEGMRQRLARIAQIEAEQARRAARTAAGEHHDRRPHPRDPEAPTGKQVAAFFDYDGTLIEGFSAVAIARARSAASNSAWGGTGLPADRPAWRRVEQDYAEVLRATKPTFADKSYAELLDFGATLFS